MDRPALVAHFVVDSEGIPSVVHQGDRNHYRIKLMVEGAPEDTYAVTYELHESYYEPIRESRSSIDGFAEEITSYGDYEVRATVRGKRQTQLIVATLSDALSRGQAKHDSEAIREALAYIRHN